MKTGVRGLWRWWVLREAGRRLFYPPSREGTAVSEETTQGAGARTASAEVWGTGWRCLQSNRTPAQRNVRPIWEVNAEQPPGCWRTLPEDNAMLSFLHHTGASSVTDFGHYWWLFINVLSKHLLNILYMQMLFYWQCGKEWRSKHPCSQKASPLSYKEKEHKLVETIKMGKTDEGLSREWHWKFNLKRGKGLSAQRQGGGTCRSSDIGWDDCIRETERTMGREQLGEGMVSAVSWRLARGS